jgi:hypothetical protein
MLCLSDPAEVEEKAGFGYDILKMMLYTSSKQHRGSTGPPSLSGALKKSSVLGSYL